MAFKRSNLEELIGPLRVQIGDIGPVPTYSDETLHLVLRYATSALMVKWRDKYFVDVEGVVHRNSNETFDFSSPPEIQSKDWRAIVLQASIMIKSGTKFSESGNVASWRDEEIAYSNIESARQRSSTLDDDVAELNRLFPTKLARTGYGKLYGWTKDWE